MDWKDPQSPWAKAMRRQIRRSKLSLVVGLVPAVGLVVLAGWVVTETSLAEDLTWPLAAVLLVPAVFAAAVPALIWRETQRQSRLAKLVREHDAFVCTRCRTPLTGLPDEGKCRRCRASYSRSQVQDYWDQYPYKGHLAYSRINARWYLWLPERLHSLRESRPTLWVALPTLLFVTGFCVAYPLTSILLGADPLATIARKLPTILTLLSIGAGNILITRYFVRVGQTRHCAKCGYQQAPSGQVGPLCPECGAPWTAPGGTVVGKRTGRPWMLWWGVGLSAVALLLFAAPLLPGVTRLGVLYPTSILLRMAAADDTLVASRAWAQLGDRQLTAEQKIRLAQSLLQARLDRGRMSWEAGQWFMARIAANELPRDLVRRYYREAVRAWLSVPQTVRIGEQFRVALESEYRWNWGSLGTTTEVVYFSGFFVGIDGPPVERRDRHIFLSLLGNPSYRPAVDLVAPEEEGPLEICAVFWLVVGPSSDVLQPIQWQADGSPVIPATADWAERIELRQVVQVQK